MSESQREFDVLVWGATGFTGRICAEYLQARYATSNLTWAIGGRNEQKLAGVRGDLGLPDTVTSVVADGHDADALAELVRRARVVLTTVGPYAKYGNELVAACAAAGTHYCDLTGEVYWMRRMIDAHQEEARASGARIVHTCGFDSIPSDIGTYFIQREMAERHGVPASEVKYVAAKSKGGVSGGTLDSAWTMMEQAKTDPTVMSVGADPYALNPPGMRGLDGPDRNGARYDADFGGWVGPFVMSQINTRVVRRTNALLDNAYGSDFRYSEGTLTGAGTRGWFGASAVALGMGAFGAMTAFDATRGLLQKRLPQPGEGPDEETRRTGFFEIELFARHPDDGLKNLRARVKGDADPGYGSTAKMLVESAVCLAQDDLTVGGGFWTPASAMGDQLLERLPENAGVTFEIV
ncbi:MAG: saccharopine dehydrogenase NADP-binding domain-containing protein [Pseudomonadota bacterium]